MNRAAQWMFIQSGVIPYRRRRGQVEVLLITSRKRRRWVIPKGIVETPLCPADSAAKEAWEEAGILGQVIQPPLGTYEYNKWGGTCYVEVFLFQVESVMESWPEEWRDRQWLSLNEAAGRVDEADLKQMILAVPAVIDSR
jgi:8-oxo-dGTP pyrophosphatase MutT (NUDIX family)